MDALGLSKSPQADLYKGRGVVKSLEVFSLRTGGPGSYGKIFIFF